MSKPPTLADHLAARVENKRIVVSRDPDGVLQGGIGTPGLDRPDRTHQRLRSMAPCLRSSVHDLTMTGIDPPRPAACIEMFQQRDRHPPRRVQRLAGLRGGERLRQSREFTHRQRRGSRKDHDAVTEAQ